LPVIKGVKYGANAWIHMRDFKTPNKKGCWFHTTCMMHPLPKSAASSNA
jgi:hypothetical protein